jgi:repressor LexA
MISENIRYLRKNKGYSQEQLARKLNIKQASVSNWESGKTQPDMKYLVELAKIFEVTTDMLLSEEPRRELDSIRVIRNAVPILGSIPCGELNAADQNPDGYADLPEGTHADFALRCQGDSMAPTFLNGDLVLIRQQPRVDNGQIAAVNVDGETTMKRVYVHQDGLHLVADNPRYQPIFVPADSGAQIIIHGLAVGYTRLFD